MKLKITNILALAILLSTSAFATSGIDNVSRMIQLSFEKKFADAKVINWTSTENYVKASFELDGQFISAYYSRSGDMIGIARNITTTQLPINLQVDLKKKLGEGWISELFEYSTDDETTYYMTIQGSNQQILLKSQTNSLWSLVKKTRK